MPGKLSFAIVLAACALSPVVAQRRPVDLEAADCSQHQSMWGDFEVAYASQHATVPAGGTLEVDPDRNGGVKVERGTGPAYTITACAAAGASTFAEAQQAAQSVSLSIDGSRVRVKGPSGTARNWNVQLIVEAPPNANVRATTTNGPIGFEDVTGTFSGEASNGPISLHNVEGTVTARAQNGPISVHGGRGTFDVQTANGPISVSLEGQRWEGKLDARAQNGPLNVNVPDGFASGVEISSASRSPWSCRVAECRGTIDDFRDRDRLRSLRIGPDPVVVKISTVNGPVTVSSR